MSGVDGRTRPTENLRCHANVCARDMFMPTGRPASARAPRIVRSSDEATHGRDTGSSTPMAMRMRVRIAPPLRSGSQAFAGSLAASAPSAWTDNGNARRRPHRRSAPTSTTADRPAGSPSAIRPRHVRIFVGSGRLHRMVLRPRDRTSAGTGEPVAPTRVFRCPRDGGTDRTSPPRPTACARPHESRQSDDPCAGHADIGIGFRFGREKNADGGKVHGGGM